MIGVRILLLSSGQGKKMLNKEVSVRPSTLSSRIMFLLLLLASLFFSECSFLLPRCFRATVNHVQVKGENGLKMQLKANIYIQVKYKLEFHAICCEIQMICSNKK